MLKNPLLERIFDSISLYRNEKLDAEGLGQNIAATMTALEGDIPKSMREALFKAESDIELIRFTVDQDQERIEIEKVLRKLEQALTQGPSINLIDEM
jgi:hypothetical protein